MSLIDDIKKHEGFSPTVYKCTAGYDTIGYGQRVKYLKVTDEQATEWLQEELQNLKYILADKYEWFLPSPQEVQEIVINMNYQLGVTAFSKGAIGLGIGPEGLMKIETERNASFRSTEYVAVGYWAEMEVKDSFGVYILTDVS